MRFGILSFMCILEFQVSSAFWNLKLHVDFGISSIFFFIVLCISCCKDLARVLEVISIAFGMILEVMLA